MKARLLIGVITCIAMLAILASIGGVTKAKADSPGGLTCGGYVTNAESTYFSGGNFWQLNDLHVCGSAHTYAYEIQITTNNGSTWTDWTADHVYGSGACSPGGCNGFHQDGAAGCITGSGIDGYRVHVWWQGGDAKSKLFTPQYTCNGGTI